MYLLKIKCTLMRRQPIHRAPGMHSLRVQFLLGMGAPSGRRPREASCMWYPHGTVSRHLAVR